jgi:hypothetical protein
MSNYPKNAVPQYEKKDNFVQVCGLEDNIKICLKYVGPEGAN